MIFADIVQSSFVFLSSGVVFRPLTAIILSAGKYAESYKYAHFRVLFFDVYSLFSNSGCVPGTFGCKFQKAEGHTEEYNICIQYNTLPYIYKVKYVMVIFLVSQRLKSLFNPLQEEIDCRGFAIKND